MTASRGIVAAVVVLASLLLVAAPRSARAQTEIWDATLTVGADGNSRGFLTSPSRGSLSDTTFEAGEVSFTIRALFEIHATNRKFICVSFQAGYTGDHAATTALSALTLNVGGHTLPFEGINHGQRPWGDYCWFIPGPAEDFGFETGSTLTASIVTSAPQPTAQIVSRPRDGTTYRSSEVIRVVLWFEEDVRVTGSPQLELDIGGQTRLADYVAARRGRTAAFEYTVTADDADADGVSIRANTDESSPSLLLNGGAFRWVSFLRGEVVDLGFGAVPAGAGHAVNGADADMTAPVLSAATIRYGLLELTYSKPLRSDPQMMSGVATSAWSVTVNGAPAVLAAAYIIDTVRLVLQSPVDHDDVVTVSSSVLMQDRAEPPNTEAALLDGRSVTNETPAAKPVVEIAADADAWFESEDILLTVTRTGETDETLRVAVSYSNPALLDLALLRVYLEAGESSARLTVPTRRRRPAGDRPLVISLVPDDAYDIGEAGSVSVTVRDVDVPVAVSIGASLNIANEPPTAGAIDYVAVVAEALEESPVAPEFRFLFSTQPGTAERNKDYRAQDHRLGFRAEDFAFVTRRIGGQEVQRWQATRRIAIEYLGDDEVEGDEYFTVRVEADSSTPENVRFSETPLKVIILDSDLEIDVAIQDPPSQIAENAGRSHITLAATVRQPSTPGVSSGVRLTLEEDSASVPEDVAWAGSNSRTIPVDLPASLYRPVTLNGATHWRAVVSVPLLIHDDDVEEERERFRVNLTGDSGAPNSGYIAIPGATNSARLTIVDDDRRGLVVNPTALDLAPGAEGSYTVALASEPTADVTVAASVPAADAGTVSLSPSSLAFTPGNWDTPQSVTVTAADDADGRMVEVANQAAGGDYAVVEPVAVEVEIASGAMQPAPPALAVSDAAASEADAEIAFTVSLDAASTREVTVSYETGNGTAEAGADFTGTDGVLTFAAGETSGTVAVPVIDDDAAEPGESFSLRLGAPVNAVLGDALGVGRITDDDDLPMLSVLGATASESDGTVDFDVTLTAASGREVSVQIRTDDGTAVQGRDYGAVVGELRFPAGETRRVVGVAVTDDTVDEPDLETFTLTLSSPENATLATATATGSIRDDDVAPVVSAEDTIAAETGGEMVFSVGLTSRTESTVTVDYETVDVTATAGSDYRSTSGTLTFAAGETAKSVAVTLLRDLLEEGDEVFTLRLDDAQNARLGASGDGTIRDGGATALRIADAAAAEASGALEFVVTASGTAAREMRVAYATRDGTATAGEDYTETQGTLVFAVGETRKTIRVPVAMDSQDDEGFETLTVVLSGAVNATLADPEATGTISDTALPRLSVSDAAAVEEGEDAVFAVTLTAAAPQDVSFGYKTADGSATAGADYTQAGGRLTIPAGGTEASIAVATAEDGLDEDDEETFEVRLEQPLYATIADGAATGTIADADPTPTLSVGNATTDEGESLEFAVELSAASALEVTVEYETADGTAKSPADYTETAGTLTFGPGETELAVPVPVYQDRLDEDTELLSLVLKSPANAGFDGAEELARGFILDDDDPPVLELVLDPIEVAEQGETSAVLTVRLAGDSAFAEDTTVGLALSGPAQAGVDYRVTDADGNALADPWELVLAAGEDSVTAQIQAIDDEVDEEVETVTIGAVRGRSEVGSPLTLRIADDDEAGVVVSPAALTLAEGGTGTYTVALASEPTASVTVTVSSDNEDVTAGGPLTFTASDWSTAKTVTVTAAQDSDATDDTATLTNTAEGGGYDGESAGVAVTVTDDETAPTAIALTVSPASVEEDDGATTVTVTATLDGSVTLGTATEVRVSVGGGTATSGTDYTAVDAFTVTIGANESSGTGTFTLTPTNDSLAEGDETIDVTGVATDFMVTQAQVTLTDDVPPVEVSYSQASYTVAEGSSLTVTVELSGAPEREVEVALTHTAQGNTTAADYSGVPTSVTFASDETSKTFSFAAAPDEVDDDGDSVVLGFGSSLPASVTAGSPATATVNITDNDDPAVTVSFGASSYTVAEGSSLTVTVELSGAPEREVEVALTHTAQGNTTAADYSGVPTSVTFDSDETEQTFTFTAAADDADDDGDSVVLGFETPLPDGVSAGATATSTVSITDDDVPPVQVSFGASSYTVAEGSSLTVTVELSAAPERSVSVPLTHTAQGDTSSGDYSLSATSVTFAADETSATFTVSAASDSVDDDGESVVLGFGTTLPTGFSEGDPDEATVSITDDPADVPSVSVSFGASSYTVAEGATVTVTVELDIAPEREVEVPLTHTAQGNTTAADYSGVPTSVTFDSDETEQTFTFTAAADDADDDGDSVLLGFGTPLPDGVSAGATATSTVSITDDDVPPVQVSFGASSYTVAEGSSLTVTVELSAAPERSVSVPLTHTAQGDTSSGDYSLSATSVTFAADETSATFTVSAASDSVDDDGESVVLGFGTTLPTGFSEGDPDEATVSITDDPADVPSVSVSFGASSYTVAEGATVTVTVELDIAPEREVEVALTHTAQGNTTAADYSGVPTSVTFDSDETEQTFTFTAADDDADDDGDSVVLGFETPLPDGVSAGATATSTVSITDDDVPPVQVSFGASSYTVAEGSSLTVTVELSGAPEREVEVALTHTAQGNTTAADYSGVPTSVTFASDETSNTFSFAAAPDEVDDDGDSVVLGFGSSLPASVTAGSPATATVNITDNDDPAVTVSFGASSYTVAEGSSLTVTVELSAAPERSVSVPLTHTAQGDTSSGDYSLSATSVTFAADETSATFTVSAASDSVDDDGESVVLGFGTTLPTGFSEGDPDEATVSITDDPADVPSVSVSFGASSYTVAEGATVTVTVELDIAPEREVEVPLTHTAQGDTTAADYSGVPTSVTFDSDETEQTFTFTAADDDVDDDGDSVLLGFGTPLPDGVSAGATATSTVSITDDDVPPVQVSFGASSYTVAEGATVTVTVELDIAPEREVEVPLTHTAQGDTTAADYSGVPTSVTFDSDETEQTFTFTAADDDVDDDGDSVLLGFGTPLPDGVSAGATATSTVSITDDDVPPVQVSFGASSYTVAEGSSLTVTVELSGAPEREVEVPLTHTAQGNTTAADYSGVPTSVTFASDETSKTFSFAAAPDEVDDDGDSVVLGFGSSLPASVTAGSPATATVNITDNDDPAVTVSFGASSYTVAEGSSLTVTVELSAAPERSVSVPLTHTAQGDTSSGDYSLSATSVTFAADETSATFTVSAASDSVDDDGESVVLGFGTTLPTGFSEGDPDEATVSITDDDTASASITLTALPVSVSESATGTTVTVTATLDGSVTRPSATAVTVSVGGGTATSGTDYAAVSNFTVTILKETASETGTFTLTPTQDTIAEGDETIDVTGTATGFTVTKAEMTLTDDDTAQRTVSFDKQVFTVTEGATRQVLMQVDLSGPMAREVAIPLTTTHGSGVEANDYVLAAIGAGDYYAGNDTWTSIDGNLIFAPAETAKIVRVTAVDDSIVEDDEVLELGFGILPEGISPGSIQVARVTITDNDGDGDGDGDNDNSDDDANRPPAFTSPVSFSVAENRTAVETVVASDSDGADIITGYALAGGADRALFSIDAATGALRFLAPPNHEEPADADANNACEVVVEATSGTDDRARTAQQSIRVTVTDVDEQPKRPAAPRVDRTAGSATSLDVSWIRPGRNGGPPITGYELRYRPGGGEWSDWPHAGTGTSTVIRVLETDTSYQVQVRALNGESPSEWSPSGMARTPKPPPARVRNVRIVSDPGSDGVWSAGERVEVEVVYPVPVVVEKPEDCWSYNADGTCRESGPFVLVVFGDDARPRYGKSLSTPLAPYVGGSGTATLRFAYTVGEDEDGALSVSAADNGILLRGATIRTLEGGEGKPEYTNTRVAQVTVERSGRAWTAGEKVRVKVRFTGPAQYTPPDDPENRDEVVVDDTGGVPTIDLKLGDRVNREQTRTASYESGSRSDTLVFEYEVAAGDGRVGAVEVVADSLAKNGATIRNEEGYDAELDHLGAVQYAQRAALSVADAEATEGVDATLDFVVKLDGVPGEEGVTVAYRTQDGEAEAGSDYEETRGTLTFTLEDHKNGVYEKTVSVPITDDAEEDGGETFKLLLSNVTGASVKNYEAVGTIRNDEAQESETESEPKPETPTVDVADARVREAAGATLDFVVTLSGASTDTVTVDYRTVDASAKAGEDYTKREDTLTFDPGETSKTIRVTVLDDAHDEGNEKMTLVLYRASGAIRDDYLAAGIIENSDPMPRAWLARFGRTASDHVVEAIAERWRGGEAQRPRTHFTLGGRPASNLFGGGDANGGVFHPAGAGNPALADESDWAQRDRLNAETLGPAGGPLGGDPVAGRSPAGGRTTGGQAARFALMNALGLPTGGLRDVLMGSSFFYSRPLDEAGGQPGGLGQWSAWGRTAATRFSGADGKLALTGEVATAILGVDSRRNRWLAGVTLSYSEGEGAYTQPGAAGGGVSSTLTSLNPYLQYRFSERTHLWAVAGYGVGGLTLTPESSESVIDTDLEHAMAAFGGRGVFSVRSSRFGAFEFAVRSDALVTNTVSAAADNLISAAGAASRVRLMLEGSGSMPLGSSGMLRPTLEAGLRYDGGDAETGAGLEIGGGLGYAAGSLAVEVRARMLLAHQDAAYEEWGFSGSVRYQPRSGGRGLSVNLGSTWGQAQSGVQSLWTRPDAGGLAPAAAMHAAQRFQAEFGYGFAGRRAGALWTPYAGIDRSGGRQALRLGVKLALGDNVEAGLEVGRLDSGRARGRADGVEGPEHAVQLRGSIRW